MIIPYSKTIIPACDVDSNKFEEIIKCTSDLEKIGAYKIGFTLVFEIGLYKAVEICRKYTDKPIIYDHQKAGTDIPDTGKKFMRLCKDAGINAVILFPQAGCETQKVWTEQAKENDLGVIVGGLMTHKGYTRSEGGYIAEDAIIDIYLNAVKNEVTDFVVPGTKPSAIEKIRDMLENQGIEPVLYSPGILTQGGSFEAALTVAGNKWHAIVGRALCEADDVREKSQSLIKLLN